MSYHDTSYQIHYKLIEYNGAYKPGQLMLCFVSNSDPSYVALDISDIKTSLEIAIFSIFIGCLLMVSGLVSSIFYYVAHKFFKRKEEVKDIAPMIKFTGVLELGSARRGIEVECCVCKMARPSTMLEPCKHECLCEDCCKGVIVKYGNCPICRTVISKVYITSSV